MLSGRLRSALIYLDGRGGARRRKSAGYRTLVGDGPVTAARWNESGSFGREPSCGPFLADDVGHLDGFGAFRGTGPLHTDASSGQVDVGWSRDRTGRAVGADKNEFASLYGVVHRGPDLGVAVVE